MLKVTHSANVFLPDYVMGQDVIDATREIVTQRSRNVGHKVGFIHHGKSDAEGNKLFLIGQESDFPWEDFVINPHGPDQAGRFNPVRAYNVLVVSHARHLWTGPKKDDEDMDKMFRTLSMFADTLADTLGASRLLRV